MRKSGTELLSASQMVNGTQRLKSCEETVELILRTVISVNQFSIYGAVADLCKELDPDSRNQTEGESCESLVIH